MRDKSCTDGPSPEALQNAIRVMRGLMARYDAERDLKAPAPEALQEEDPCEP